MARLSKLQKMEEQLQSREETVAQAEVSYMAAAEKQAQKIPTMKAAHMAEALCPCADGIGTLRPAL